MTPVVEQEVALHRANPKPNEAARQPRRAVRHVTIEQSSPAIALDREGARFHASLAEAERALERAGGIDPAPSKSAATRWWSSPRQVGALENGSEPVDPEQLAPRRGAAVAARSAGKKTWARFM